MRQILWILALALTSSFAASRTVGTVTVPETKSEETYVKALIDKARWGDGQAFLKLADCYCYGNGVKQDFFGMIYMIIQAKQHGATEESCDYVQNLPDDNNNCRLAKILDAYLYSGRKKRDSVENVCYAIATPDAYAFLGMLAFEDKDFVKGYEMLKAADVRGGSTLTTMISCAYDLESKNKLDIAKLETLASSSPAVYMFLAENCSGKGNDMKRAEYLLKAEENAVLDKLDAQWLLDYCKGDSTLRLSEEDIRRIESFASIEIQDEIMSDTVVDTVFVDD